MWMKKGTKSEKEKLFQDWKMICIRSGERSSFSFPMFGAGASDVLGSGWLFEILSVFSRPDLHRVGRTLQNYAHETSFSIFPTEVSQLCRVGMLFCWIELQSDNQYRFQEEMCEIGFSDEWIIGVNCNKCNAMEIFHADDGTASSDIRKYPRHHLFTAPCICLSTHH